MSQMNMRCCTAVWLIIVEWRW